MSSASMFSTYIHLYPTGNYFDIFWTDTKAHLSCILKLERSTHSQRCLLLNGSEMTNNVSVETCWVPFKVNNELINAFQNLCLMSATVSWAVQHQKHIHAHSGLEENPSPRKRIVPFHVLTHIHTLKPQTQTTKETEEQPNKHEPVVLYPPPWSSKYSSSKFASSCFCLFLSSFISFSCSLRAMAYKQTNMATVNTLSHMNTNKSPFALLCNKYVTVFLFLVCQSASFHVRLQRWDASFSDYSNK